MQSTTIAWPASYKGVGLAILTLPDGTYQGVAQGGYRSAPYATTKEALADVTATLMLREASNHAHRIAYPARL